MHIPRGLAPTPLASNLYVSTAKTLALLQETLNRKEGFDPVVSEHIFSIAMTDIGEVVFTSLAKAPSPRGPKRFH